MDYRPTNPLPSRKRTPAALIAAIETTLVKAETLFADGYQIQPGIEPRRFEVIRPGEITPAYAITVQDDTIVLRGTGELVTRWRYYCSCPLYHEQERHLERLDSWWAAVCGALAVDGAVCKHGEALIRRIEQAHALMLHLDAFALTGNIIWDRPADKKPPNSPVPEKPGWNPWPTRTANTPRRGNT